MRPRSAGSSREMNAEENIIVQDPKKVRVALIGFGKLGILHSAVVNMVPNAELVAIADVNKQLATYIQQAGLKAPFYSDVDKMVAEVQPEAAVICTPAFANLPVVRQCLVRDMDLFVEKPLAHTFAAAKTLLELASSRTIVHATGYLFAHMNLFKKAKSLLDDGVLGPLYRVRSAVYTSEVFSKKKGWYYDPEKSGGGAVMNIAAHLLYILYWYFGLPQSVFAQTKYIYSDVDDAGTAFLQYAGGMQATMDVSWSVPGYRLPYTEINIEADNGMMTLTNDAIKLYLYKANKGFPKEWTTIHKIDLGSTSRFEIGAEGLFEEGQDFVDCCLERRTPAVSWKDGFEVQRLIEAIYRSAARTSTVLLGEIQ
jgi:predicted dehydrogenase